MIFYSCSGVYKDNIERTVVVDKKVRDEILIM
jgi:hypothetical protein